jgi:adenylate cyclase
MPRAGIMGGEPERGAAGAYSYVRRQTLGALVLLLLCLLTAPFFLDNQASDSRPVINGQVDYRGYGQINRAIQLSGDWSFRWLSDDPRVDPALAPPVMRVPGEWEGKPSSDGRPLPEQGRASYSATLTGLQPGTYGLYVPQIYAANRILIDGKSVSQRGVLGDSGATSRYFLRAHHLVFQVTGEPVRIEIEIAAYLHRDNGIDTPPMLALEPAMEYWRTIHWAQEVLFHTALVLLACYGLVVFFYQRSEQASLFFALSCFLFLIPSSVLGFDNLLMLAMPQLSFPTMLPIFYLSTEASLTLFLAYGHRLFPEESPVVAYRILIGVLGLLWVSQAASFIFFDTLTASHVNSYLLPVLLAVFSYLVFVLVRAIRRQRDGALMFLLGIGVFFVSLVMLAIVAYGVLPRDRVIGFDFTTYGILILLFSHIIVLAERWSMAKTATEQSNSELRQLLDVNMAITGDIKLETLLGKIVDATAEILHADRASLFLYDDATDELWALVAHGLSTNEIRLPADTGIVGEALTSGAIVSVSDAYAHPKFNPAVDQRTGYRTRTILAMPILSKDGRKLGVMEALNRSDGMPFDIRDISRMQAFSAQAAIAIDNAKLFSEVVESRNFNESILQSMSSGVVTLQDGGRQARLNDAAARMLGASREQAEAADARAFLSTTNPWLVEEIDAVSISGQSKSILDHELVTFGSGTISANVSIVPLRDEEKTTGVLLMVDDISSAKRLEGAMRRFMTQEVMDQVLAQKDELLFGLACHASVLFADIRNFTTLAETLSPRDTVDMLNEIFTDLFEAVADADGVLDKYIGDAVMAVFGAPLSTGQDAHNAVRSAIRMQEMMGAINVRRAGRGSGELRLGVGIATGDVVAGTIGSPKRMDYTVIGDSVNLAARLQDITKAYQVGIIICERTAQDLGDQFTLREIDTIRVKGRARPERIFEVLIPDAIPAD